MVRIYAALTFAYLVLITGMTPALCATAAPTAGVNLPDPAYSCTIVLQHAGTLYHTDRFATTPGSVLVSQLYRSALDLEAARTAQLHPTQRGAINSLQNLSIQQLIAAYADLMGCFVSHAPGQGSLPAPAPSSSSAHGDGAPLSTPTPGRSSRARQPEPARQRRGIEAGTPSTVAGFSGH